jgi:hypothetical protein
MARPDDIEDLKRILRDPRALRGVLRSMRARDLPPPRRVVAVGGQRELLAAESAAAQSGGLGDEWEGVEGGLAAFKLARDEALRILSYVDDPIDRLVFHLRAVLDMTWDEIVERLAVTIGAPCEPDVLCERHQETRAYLRACMTIESELEARRAPVTPAVVRAEARRRGVAPAGPWR